MTTMRNASSASCLVGRRVLVVESDFLIAGDIARALEKLDAEVIGPHARISQGRAALEHDDFDLAILDVYIGQELAFEFAGALSERGIPVIFVNSLDRDRIPDYFRGATLLEKPFTEAAISRFFQAESPNFVPTEKNALLTRFPTAAIDDLHPHMRLIPLAPLCAVIRPGQSPEFAYFPTSGILSVLIGPSGKLAEIALIGREGAFGFSGTGGRSPFWIIPQRPSFVISIPSRYLQAAFQT